MSLLVNIYYECLCWAVSFSTTMSDCLVASGAVTWRPGISPTFCMACYPQGRCKGGFPAKLAEDIEQNGVADQTCMDYSWCANNSGCSGKPSEHLSANVVAQVPECGCMVNTDKYFYHIDRGTDMISITDDLPQDKYFEDLKSHIMTYGPVIGGYAVLNNFLKGEFTKSNGGVYFDRADYGNMKPNGDLFFSNTVKQSSNIGGLHAVSIVGWGVAKNILYDNDHRGDVPFWHCRNSWGPKWGDRGYFKIAMYPYNQTAQFDKEVAVRVKNSPRAVRIGGVCLIRATKPPIIKNLQEIPDARKRKIIPLREPEFYERMAKESNIINPPPPPPPSSNINAVTGQTSMESNIMSVLAVIAALVIGVIISLII